MNLKNEPPTIYQEASNFSRFQFYRDSAEHMVDYRIGIENSRKP